MTPVATASPRSGARQLWMACFLPAVILIVATAAFFSLSDPYADIGPDLLQTGDFECEPPLSGGPDGGLDRAADVGLCEVGTREVVQDARGQHRVLAVLDELGQVRQA